MHPAVSRQLREGWTETELKAAEERHEPDVPEKPKGQLSVPLAYFWPKSEKKRSESAVDMRFNRKDGIKPGDRP